MKRNGNERDFYCKYLSKRPFCYSSFGFCLLGQMLHLHIISAKQGLHCTLSCPQSWCVLEFPSKIQLIHCIAIDCSALTSSFPLQWLIDHTQHTGEKWASSMQHYCCWAPAPKALLTCLSRARPVWPQGNQQNKHCAEDGSLHWFISPFPTLAFTSIYSNPSLPVSYPPSTFQGNRVGSKSSTKI